jgi:sialic acid synthase SpsE
MGVFVIAEAGSSHDNDLQKAYRLIEAAKECGADACKFQWTSDALKMASRRGFYQPGIQNIYYQYLKKPVSWLESLKAHADKVGIEFMCTVYLIEDIAVIAPLVKRFKVSAFESGWGEFVHAHDKHKKPMVISIPNSTGKYALSDASYLWCVSKYPTPLEQLQLRRFRPVAEDQGYVDYPSNRVTYPFDGLSDHTANVLTGAAAVAAGARIIEAHIRLDDTSPDNPDYKHSLRCGKWGEFQTYVENIRTVERML